MDMLGDPKLPHWLRRLNTKDFKKFDTFIWNGSHIDAVVRYVLRQYSDDVGLNNLLRRLDTSTKDPRFPSMVLSFTNKLRGFFVSPTAESSTFSGSYDANEILAGFLDFLLDVAQEVVKHHAKLIDLIDDDMAMLQKQLQFVIAVLGDTPFRCTKVEETRKFVEETTRLANEAGRFLYQYFFTEEGTLSRMDLSLLELLRKFENFQGKIREHCLKVSKLPCFIAPNIAVESTFIVHSLVDDLQDLLDRNDDLIAHVWEQMGDLLEELVLLKSFLKDQHNAAEIVQIIQDVAYEADYVINSFVIGDVPDWYLNVRLPSVIQNTKLIRIGLEGIVKNHNNSECLISLFMVGDVPVCLSKRRLPDFQDININVSMKDSVAPSQEENNMSSDDIMVGFEDEAMLIADQLTGKSKELQVICIFGMAGLGKTTLGKKLYNNPAVFHWFDRCATVVVSESYQKRRLLADILQSVGDLNQDKITSMDSESLGLELHKSLKGRRFLVYMDDVWSSSVWDAVRRFLPDDRNGSRVLLTSRNKEVLPPNSIIHALPFLSEEQCWDLLKQRVFQKQDCPQELVETGKDIARQCQRLPLAVVVIAAVLTNMKDKKSAWVEVLRSLGSQISSAQNKCMDIMELSYKHLPAHLKPCFLYFGAFPEDSAVSVRRLVSLWIAEGFIQKEDEKSPQKVAEEYLTDLINRSLVIVAKRHPGGGIKACSVHDILHRLCLNKAMEENFLNLITDKFPVYEKHRSLCIPPESANAESRPFGKNIRSWMGYWSNVSFVYSRLKRLRVLDASVAEHLQDSGARNDVDLTGIEQLVLLRYLAVSLAENQIPPSIGHCLWNLEFLLLDGLGGVEIPETILGMTRLRHLHIRRHGVFTESCHKRAAVEQDPYMNNLESVSNLRIARIDDEKILRRAPHICRLKCVTEPLWDSSEKCYRYLTLNYLHLLDSLSMTYLSSDRKFSGTFNFPISLRKLTLKEFRLSFKEMSMIGQLPKLEVLKLLYPIFAGREWKTNDDEFQELRFLKIEALKIHRWTTSDESFPKLQHLTLQRCWKLKQLPSRLGDISTLQIIEVHSCSDSAGNSALKIREKQLEYGYEQLKVIVSGTGRE